MNFVRNIIMLLCLCFFTQAALHGQDIQRTYARRLFTTRDGLPKLAVTSLFQDRSGYLWVGTKGGLACYDGVSFTPYTIREGLYGNVNNIMQLDDGRIVVYTSRGIQLINKGEVSTLYTDTNYKFYNTNACRLGKKIIARTDPVNPPFKKGEVAIISFDTETMKFSLLGYVTHSLDELFSLSGEGSVLFSTDSVGKDYYYSIITSNGISKKLKLPFEFCFASRKVNGSAGLILDKKGGVFKFDGTENNLQIRKVYGLKRQTSLGLLMLCHTRDNSIFYIDAQSALIRCRNGIEEVLGDINIATAALEDRSGNFWLASEDGLYCFYNFTFREYYWNFNKDKPDFVWSMSQSPDSIFWIGSYTDGIFSYKESQGICRPLLMKIDTGFKKISSPHFHPVVKNNTLYYPAYNRVIMIKNEEGSAIEDSGSANLFLYDDPVTGNILTCDKGIKYVDSDKVIKDLYTADQVGLKRSLVLSLCRDKYGRLWYAASGTVGCIDKVGKAHAFDVSALGSCYSIICDTRHNLWFAGNSGLWYYDYRHLKKIEDLQLQNIGALHDYKGRYLVMSSTRGVGLLNLDSFYLDRYKTNFYAANNGFNGLDFSQNSILEDLNGYIWINTSNTVIKFHPDSLLPNTVPIPVIRNVEASPDNVHWFEPQTQLYFKYPQNNVRFSFAAVAINHSGTIYYKYRLKGFTGWSLITKETRVTYTNITGGDYAFEVRASLDGFHWSDVITTGTISILPAWYQTIYFYMVVVALLMALGILIVLTYLKEHRKKMEENSRLLGLQLQAIRNRMLPHLTNNVYTNIILLIKKDDPAKAIEYTYILSRLNNKMLSLSEHKSQSLKLELKFVEEYLQLQKLIYKDKLNFLIDIANDVDTAVQVPIMALHTFAENALKHGIANKEAGGTICIKATNAKDGILLQVTDDGVGRKNAAKFNADSSRQGLFIFEEMIKMFNRKNKKKITVIFEDLTEDNDNVCGTSVRIFIPQPYKY